MCEYSVRARAWRTGGNRIGQRKQRGALAAVAWSGDGGGNGGLCEWGDERAPGGSLLLKQHFQVVQVSVFAAL